MNEPTGESLKELYDKSKHKQLLWILMRFIAVYNDIIHNSSTEIHIPRNTKELFTYNSDKYWAKVIYGINHLIKYPHANVKEIHESIHLGSRNNLIYYWYPILKNYKRLPEIEIKYYLLSTDMTSNKCLPIYSNFITDDKFIAQIIYSIHDNINNFNKNASLKLLDNFSVYPDTILRDLFYTYLTEKINDPCIESENREQLVNIILDYYCC